MSLIAIAYSSYRLYIGCAPNFGQWLSLLHSLCWLCPLPWLCGSRSSSWTLCAASPWPTGLLGCCIQTHLHHIMSFYMVTSGSVLLCPELMLIVVGEINVIWPLRLVRREAQDLSHFKILVLHLSLSYSNKWPLYLFLMNSSSKWISILV